MECNGSRTFSRFVEVYSPVIARLFLTDRKTVTKIKKVTQLEIGENRISGRKIVEERKENTY